MVIQQRSVRGVITSREKAPTCYYILTEFVAVAQHRSYHLGVELVVLPKELHLLDPEEVALLYDVLLEHVLHHVPTMFNGSYV